MRILETFPNYYGISRELGDFSKFCGLLRISELYILFQNRTIFDRDYSLHFRNLLLLNKVVETDNSEIGYSLRKTPNMLQPLQNPQQSLQMQIQWATVGSLEDWYNCLFDKMPLETNRLLKLKNITEMVNFLTNDLRETCGKFQKHFQDCLGLDYSR